MTGLEPGTLDTAHGALPYVRCGSTAAPQLLIVQPLFEERNRLRRLLAAMMRRLAERGIGSWMFDFPATGESPLPTDAAAWDAWQGSLRTAAEHIRSNHGEDLHILSFRGGSLFDALPGCSLYRVAPVQGDRILRELLRARAAGADGETVGQLDQRLMAGEALDLAGYHVPASLAASLRAATLNQPDVPVRTAAIGGGEADLTFDGPPLWRQAEPEANLALADALATDVADWISQFAR